MDQFTQWYNRMFNVTSLGSQNGVQSHQTPVLSDLQQSMGDLTSDGDKPQKSPAQRLGTPNGQRIGEFTYDRAKMFLEVYKIAPDVSTSERNNTIMAMEGEGAFKSITSYQQGVDLVIARLNSPEHGKGKKKEATG